MARKKLPEEHENLERYLVSYADFMTLMFATFVVLYALAQSDVDSFKNIEEAMRRAFSQNIFENQENILDGSDSILQGQTGAMNPLMLEYMSQKYEQDSFNQIEKEIGELGNKGITSDVDNRGLVIRLSDDAVSFRPGSAELARNSIETLNKVASIIKSRFAIHYIRVEGHSDSDAISNPRFPTNWELSSARACSVIRFLIKAHGFNPKIFTAAGLADTVPLADNTTPQNKAKNRRVEIVILKNQDKSLTKKNMQDILKEVQAQRNKSLKSQLQPSKAIEGLVGNDKELLKNVIDMSDQYENETKRLESLEKEGYSIDGDKPEFLNNNKNGIKQ